MPSVSDLHREHEPALRRLARHLLRDSHLAEDVLQEAWVASLRRPRQVENSLTWLRAVVRNLSAQANRRRRLEREAEHRAVGWETAAGPLEELERETVVGALRACVEELAEPYRSVIQLRYLEGLESDTIARLLDRPSATVRSQLQRGLARLRADLDRRKWPAGETWCTLCAWAFRLDPAVQLEPSAPNVASTGAGTRVLAGLLAAACVAIGIGLFPWHPRIVAGAKAPIVALLPVSSSSTSPGSRTRPPMLDAPEALREVQAPLERAASAIDLGSAPARGRPLDVRVLDEEDNPVVGAEVHVARGTERRLGATTDAAGHARIELTVDDLDRGPGVDWPDQVTLVATGPGPTHSEILVVRLGAPSEVRPALRLYSQLVTVRGRVFEDSLAHPIGAARVIATRRARLVTPGPQMRFRGWTAETETASDGSFELDVPEGKVQLAVLVDGVSRMRKNCDTGPGPVFEVALGLAPLGALAGQVLGLDGRPLGGARICWQKNVAEAFVTTADVDGRYHLPNLLPGAWHFSASSPDDASAAAQQQLEVQPRETTYWSPRIAHRAGLRLRVVDDSGRALAGTPVRVRAQGDAKWGLTTKADEDGAVVVFTQPEGEFRVEALSESSQDAIPLAVLEPVIALEEEQLITLETQPLHGQLTGVLLDHALELLSVSRVLLEDDGGNSVGRVRFNGRGEFETPWLPAGSYRIVVDAGRLGFAALGPFELASGQRLDLGTLQTPRPGGLRFESSWAAQEHLELVMGKADRASRLHLTWRQQAEELQTFTLFPGLYRVQLRSPTEVRWANTVEIRSGVEAHVVAESDQM